jgi:hypothetical protein
MSIGEQERQGIKVIRVETGRQTDLADERGLCKDSSGRFRRVTESVDAV